MRGVLRLSDTHSDITTLEQPKKIGKNIFSTKVERNATAISIQDMHKNRKLLNYSFQQ